jgi:DNA-binding XRE family transcriptional regulator
MQTFNPKKFREYRERAGLSREALARSLTPTITSAPIQDWEFGRTQPKANQLAQSAELFGVSVEDFYDTNGSPPK